MPATVATPCAKGKEVPDLKGRPYKFKCKRCGMKALKKRQLCKSKSR